MRQRVTSKVDAAKEERSLWEFRAEVGTSLVGTLSVSDGFTLFVEAIKKYESAIDDALAIAAKIKAARDAGEFDGKDDTGDAIGPQGPQGAMGAQGPAGTDGRDRVSVTHSWAGTVLTVLAEARGLGLEVPEKVDVASCRRDALGFRP